MTPHSESSLAASHLGGFIMSFCRCFSASRRSRSLCFSARLSSTRLFPAFLSGSAPRLCASTLAPAANEHATPPSTRATTRRRMFGGRQICMHDSTAKLVRF